MAKKIKYPWTDNPTVSGVAECNTDVLNNCLMHLKYDKKSGGGLEVCDIGIALFIDETKGLRRYLNGQIVAINENTQGFLDKLLQVAAIQPDLFTTESNWQAESTLNLDGCVYKFVLNYASDGVTVESIRLPKYPEYVISIGDTAPVSGNGMTLGFTDGTHYGGIAESTDIGRAYFLSGIYGKPVNSSGVQGSFNKDKSLGITTDPTKSGLVANISKMVYKLKMKYFIQIATGQETEVIANNQLEILSGAVLFEPKFSSAPLYNVQYGAKSTTKSKIDYPDAYNALLVEVNPDVIVGTTVNISDTFSYTKRGLSVKETSASDITDFDWVVNRTDETFTLPSKSAIYSAPPSNIYLYFCIATFGQNAAIANLGRIEEQIATINSKPHIIDTYANGTSGYRVWSDGYCEQWGKIVNSSNASPNIGTVTFLKEFKSDYTLIQSKSDKWYGSNYGQSWTGLNTVVSNYRTTKQFIYNNNYTSHADWFACGYLKEGEY